MSVVAPNDRLREPPISASPRRLRKVMAAAGIELAEQFTVSADGLGFRFDILERREREIEMPPLEGSSAPTWSLVESRWVIGSILVTEASGLLYADDPDVLWLHVSMAYTIDRDPPTHADMTALKAGTFGPKRYAYSVWAPETDHVNVHPNALHLYGRRDGARLLPDFRIMGMI